VTDPSTAQQDEAAAGQRGALRLTALGGLGEIGMNCLALEQDGAMVLVDCGVTFPSSDLGVDVFHPRFDHALDREGALRGVVVTHGHEDHIGALPYLLAHVDVPVWGPPHALELVRHRLAEHGLEGDDVDLRPTTVGRTFEVGPFAFEPIRVTHSITDATALAIRTGAGLMVHTGDFKLDPTPTDGEVTDEARLAALGDEGVRLLLSDSTNVDSPGRAGSERAVGDALGALVESARGRVIVGLFASNVQRLRALGEVAVRTRRRVLLLGRSVNNHARAAQAVGRLSWPSDLLVPQELAASLPREKLLVVASGTQAERMSALTRLASGTHPALRVEEGDRVILSSRIIPGNDRAVFDLYASFLRLGVDLVTRTTDPSVHASGHAHREEQRRMIDLVRPETFLPVHGTLHHLVRHAAIAREAGVREVVVVENGETVEVVRGRPAVRAGRVPVGRVATFGGEEVTDEVLKERAQLGRAGVVFVSVVLDRRNGLVATPQVVARGVLDTADAGELHRAALAVARAVGEAASRARDLASPATDDELAEAARLAARRSVEARTGKRPLVNVALSRVDRP
jgi:ribonuclease J